MSREYARYAEFGSSGAMSPSDTLPIKIIRRNWFRGLGAVTDLGGRPTPPPPRVLVTRYRSRGRFWCWDSCTKGRDSCLRLAG